VNILLGEYQGSDAAKFEICLIRFDGVQSLQPTYRSVFSLGLKTTVAWPL
jgi:hypothetical protein